MWTASICLLLAGASRAVDVYLSPAPFLRSSTLAPDHASLAISRHLGLESFEPLGAGNEVFADLFAEKPFVGQGQKDGLILTIDEEDAKEVVPTALVPTFFLETPPLDSLDSLTNSYLHLAAHTYDRIWSGPSVAAQPIPRLLDVFSIPSAAGDILLSELSTLVDFLESERAAPGGAKFAALEVTGLRALADAYGRSSEQYAVGAATVRATLESALAQRDLNLALLTFPAAHGATVMKRQVQPAQPSQTPIPGPRPQEPIGSDAHCFASEDACTNATDSCSGRGQCFGGSRAGRTCFVCSCGATKDTKGRTTNWAGQKCERKDISGPFVLIAGTVITLILLIGGSISLLYSVGGDELPGTLTGGVAGSKRD